MALTQRGEDKYGDCPADSRDMLARYSQNNYPATHFSDAVCPCAHRRFLLEIDEDAGVAVRVCDSCESRHVMFDGEDYLEDADLNDCQCACGGFVFEITAGIALYRNSDDVRWLYIAGRCPTCGRIACYGDWKNEADDHQRFLKLA
jgi:hypothetical protein